MGCRYLIFELDNVQHLLQYCLGHRVCMVMFIPTVPLTDWSELRPRVSVWRELELSYGLRAEQRFPSISKGKVGTCQNHCPIVAIVCSLESSAFLSLSAFIFWGSDQHRRAFAALSLSLLFGSIWFVSTGRCVPGKTPTQSKSAGHISHILLCVCEQPGHANALANTITSCPPKNNSLKKTII